MLVVVTIIGLFTAAIASYYAEHGAYPTALADVRQYLTHDLPMDPWNRPYVYEVAAGEGPRVVCLGADGQPGGDGVNADVFSWK